MRGRWVAVALACGHLAGTYFTPRTTAFGGGDKKGLFAGLKAGQPVGLKDVGDVYEVSVTGDFPTGHEVVEVGADYLVVKDTTATVETRLPVTSIKAIIRASVLQRR